MEPGSECVAQRGWIVGAEGHLDHVEQPSLTCFAGDESLAALSDAHGDAGGVVLRATIRLALVMMLALVVW